MAKAKITDEVLGLMNNLNAAYKKPVLLTASSTPPVFKIPTGSPGLDYISTGGIPINRITEFIGKDASTKTYHALLAVKAFQKASWEGKVPILNAIKSVEYTPVKMDGGDIFMAVKKVNPTRRRTKPVMKRVAFVDIEGTFDKNWAAKIGVDLDGLLLFQPETMAQAVDVMQTLMMDSSICLVIVDSISAVGADAETDSSMENEQMSLNARFWNKAFRKMQAALNKNEENFTTMIVINTYYSKVGFVMGNPDTPKNGSGLKHAKALSIGFFASAKQIKIKIPGVKEEQVIGKHITVSCSKSKVGVPFKRATFFFPSADTEEDQAGVINQLEACLELAPVLEAVEKSGAFIKYKDHKAQQGQAKFMAYLEKEGLVQEFIDYVYSKF